jgi:hypothetical protein
VDAVDRCPATVERLRRRYASLRSRRPAAGRLTATVADLAGFRPVRRYGLIMLAGGMLTALGPVERDRLFAVALAALAPGGALAFDFHRHDPAAVAAEPVRLLAFSVPRPDGVQHNVVARQRLDHAAGIETIDLDSYEHRPDGTVHRATFHTRKAMLDPAALTARVRAAGGRVVARRSIAVGSAVRSFLMVCEARMGGMASCS